MTRRSRRTRTRPAERWLQRGCALGLAGGVGWLLAPAPAPAPAEPAPEIAEPAAEPEPEPEPEPLAIAVVTPEPAPEVRHEPPPAPPVEALPEPDPQVREARPPEETATAEVPPPPPAETPAPAEEATPPMPPEALAEAEPPPPEPEPAEPPEPAIAREAPTAASLGVEPDPEPVEPAESVEPVEPAGSAERVERVELDEEVLSTGRRRLAQGRFPVHGASYARIGFERYRDAMLALGGAFYLVDSRSKQPIAELDPLTFEHRAVDGDPPARLSRWPRDVTSWLGAVLDDPDVKAAYGGRPMRVMLLPPADLDAALAGGLERALELRGMRIERVAYVRLSYELSDAGLACEVWRLRFRDGSVKPVQMRIALSGPIGGPLGSRGEPAPEGSAPREQSS